MTKGNNVKLECGCGFDNSVIKFNKCPECKANLKEKKHKNHGNGHKNGNKRLQILGVRKTTNSRCKIIFNAIF